MALLSIIIPAYNEEATIHKILEKDVSCPNCFDKLTDKQKFRFRMRASQKISGKLKSNSLQRASV